MQNAGRLMENHFRQIGRVKVLNQQSPFQKPQRCEMLQAWQEGSLDTPRMGIALNKNARILKVKEWKDAY